MGWAEPTEATKAGLPADQLTWGQWEWCMGCMKQFRIQDLTASPHLSIIFRKLGVLEVKERPPTVLFLGLGFLLGRQVSIETWSIFHCDKALRVLCWPRLDSWRLRRFKDTVANRAIFTWSSPVDGDEKRGWDQKRIPERAGKDRTNIEYHRIKSTFDTSMSNRRRLETFVNFLTKLYFLCSLSFAFRFY